MKLHYFLLLIIACTCNTGFAQVQITSDDVYKEGEYKIAVAFPVTFNDMSFVGENLIWDFSGLIKSNIDIVQISAFKNDGTSKDANLTESINGNIKDYYKKTNTDIYTVTGNKEGGFQNIKFMTFPFSYGQKVSDSTLNISYYTGKTAGYDSLDSVKITTRIYLKTKADAWGILKIPNAEFNTLRFKMNINYTIIQEGKKGVLAYKIIPKAAMKDSFTYYRWYAPGQGYCVLNYLQGRYVKYFYIEPTIFTANLKWPDDIQVTNPINTGMKIRNSGSDLFRIILSDMTGKQVLEKNIYQQSDQTIDVSNLNSGFYTLQLINKKTHSVCFRKLLK